MQLFQDTHLDFFKYRKPFGVLSVILVIAGVIAVFVHGKLNIGIDFAGGTQLIVRFAEAPEPDALRSVLDQAGIGEAQIQRFGQATSGEVMIRTPLKGDQEGGEAAEVLAALNATYNPSAAGAFDLNQRGTDGLAALLFERDPEDIRRLDEDQARLGYQKVAEAIVGLRQREGILRDWGAVAALEGVSQEVVGALKAHAVLGAFAVLGEEEVGPQIGSELRRKGMWAVLLSILGMLGYIWVRFELRFGMGAVVALIHDVLVTLGLYAIMDYEFNLSTIAAFLTLVGYSVNDTVVVFDRVRENLQKNRRDPLIEVINLSLNQTLSRTILTSGTTLLTAGALFFLGGEVLRGFSFVLSVGIIVGTYSSIFVASPVAIYWERLTSTRGAAGGRRRARDGGSQPAVSSRRS